MITSMVKVAFSTVSSQVASFKKNVVGNTVRVNLVSFAALIVPQLVVINLDVWNDSGVASK